MRIHFKYILLCFLFWSTLIVNGYSRVNTPPHHILKTDSPSTKQIIDTLAPSQSELAWALKLQEMIQKGYQANEQEIEKYTSIYNRYQSHNSSSQQEIQKNENSNTVSQEEREWAIQLLKKIEKGYVPTDQEIAAYEKIAGSIPNQLFDTSQMNDSTAKRAVSQKMKIEINWAVMLEQLVNQKNYPPCKTEVALYQSIAAKLNQTQNNTVTTDSNSVSNEELDWALEIQTRSNQQKKLYPEEIKLYEHIYKRWNARKLKPLRKK